MWSVKAYEQFLTVTISYYHEVTQKGKKIKKRPLLLGLTIRFLALLGLTQMVEYVINGDNIRATLFTILSSTQNIVETFVSFHLYFKSGQLADFFYFVKYSTCMPSMIERESLKSWITKISRLEVMIMLTVIFQCIIMGRFFVVNFHPALPTPALIFFLILLTFLSISQKIIPFILFCCTTLLTNVLDVQLSIFTDSVNATIISKIQKTHNDSAIMEATEQFELSLVEVSFFLFLCII